jgi:uncharacterized protein involved in exopolysaccharide biosynthesis
MEEETNNLATLKDFFYVLFRHKFAVLSLFLLITLTVFVGLYIWPETYEATASILIKLGKQNISASSVLLPAQQQIISTGVRQEDINSEVAILNNRFLIEKVVQKLGLDFLFPKALPPETFFKRVKFEFKQAVSKIKDAFDEVLYAVDLKKRLSLYEKAVVGMQAGLSAERIKDSDVIEVKLGWFSPDIAQEALATLIDFYLEHHLEVHKTSGAYEFLQRQVEKMEQGLKESENALQQLKMNEGITSYEDQKKFLLTQITDFAASLKATETELAETSAKIHTLKHHLASQTEYVQLTKQVERNPILDSLKMKLLDLELQRMKLETNYLNDSRPVTAIKKEIQEVKGKSDAEASDVVGEITTGINTSYKDLQKELALQEVQLDALQVKKRTLEQHIASYRQDLERLNSYDLEVKRLQRQINVEEENYLLTRKKLEEARISDVLDAERIVSVSVVEPAAASFLPVKPKRKVLIVGLGLVLGVVSGIGFAFLAEYLDHSIKTPKDVDRYLGLPLLASIQEAKR